MSLCLRFCRGHQSTLSGCPPLADGRALCPPLAFTPPINLTSSFTTCRPSPARFTDLGHCSTVYLPLDAKRRNSTRLTCLDGWDTQVSDAAVGNNKSGMSAVKCSHKPANLREVYYLERVWFRPCFYTAMLRVSHLTPPAP